MVRLMNMVATIALLLAPVISKNLQLQSDL